MRVKFCLAALAATMIAGPALAQVAVTDSDTALARGTVLGNHSLRKQADLDFGVVTVDPVLSGTVTISADAAGSRSTGVALTLTPPPGGIVIDGAGNNIPVSLVLDTAGSPRNADPAGGFIVYVGGTFSLSAGQPAGVYSGQFKLTATYQ